MEGVSVQVLTTRGRGQGDRKRELSKLGTIREKNIEGNRKHDFTHLHSRIPIHAQVSSIQCQLPLPPPCPRLSGRRHARGPFSTTPAPPPARP